MINRHTSDMSGHLGSYYPLPCYRRYWSPKLKKKVFSMRVYSETTELFISHICIIFKKLKHCYIIICFAETSIEECTCCSSRSTLQWICQHVMLKVNWGSLSPTKLQHTALGRCRATAGPAVACHLMLTDSTYLDFPLLAIHDSEFLLFTPERCTK